MTDHAHRPDRRSTPGRPIYRLDILLVEDNPLDTKATFNAARKLDMAGNIEVVSDGQAALDYLRIDRDAGSGPALILLDLNLAGMDGNEVLTEIRADPKLQTVPVVVLSTSSDDRDVAGAYQRGANAYITKPVELDGWVRVISTINEFWLSVARLPTT